MGFDVDKPYITHFITMDGDFIKVANCLQLIPLPAGDKN